jgi:DnaJ-class molecular chaperone
MRSFDPYDVLGISPDADAATIRRAYQKLARRHHPDLAPGDREAERRFVRIQRAYRLLGDPARRRQFHENAADSPVRPRAKGRRTTSVATGRLGAESFLEIRSEWMEWIDTAAETSGDAKVEADVQAELTLELVEAIRGCTKSFSVQRERVCEACGGDGLAGACDRCSGRGTIVDLDRIRVRIPPGVDDGNRLRLRGKGADLETREGKGDLFLTVRVRPHSYFRRRGLDIHAELPVTFTEAVLGAELEVPTVDGPVVARLPAGTQGGQRFRLEGRGVARRDGSGEQVGDHYYTVRVIVPRGPLGAEERDALERLDRLERREQAEGGPRSALPRGLD